MLGNTSFAMVTVTTYPPLQAVSPDTSSVRQMFFFSVSMCVLPTLQYTSLERCTHLFRELQLRCSIKLFQVWGSLVL